MGELLLEIRTGGYPVSEIAEATRQLKDELVGDLRARGLPPSQSAIGFTNRRMMVLLRGLPEHSGREKDRLRILAGAIEDGSSKVEWRQTMSWAGGGPWVRPILGVLAIHDGQVVPATVAGVQAGDSTIGHPTLSPRRFRVEDGDDYGGKLAARGIEVRYAERVKILESRVEAAAAELGGTVAPDRKRIERVAASCEIPGVVTATVGAWQGQLPRDLVVAGLRRTLDCFLVEREGELLPVFIGWMDRPDDPQQRVQRGYELASASCLANLKFLFDRDRTTPLAQLARDMAGQEWHPGLGVSTLGTFGNKTERLRRLGAALCAELRWDREADHVEEAAVLLFADRDRHLVRELPELRGVLGGLLAKAEGFAESVWRAIHEHGASDHEPGSPSGRVGRVVALAERVDSLVGRLAVETLSGAERSILGQSETGQSEPRPGLARVGHTPLLSTDQLARSVVRLLMESDLPLDLDLVVARAVRGYSQLGIKSDDLLVRTRSTVDLALRDTLDGAGYLPGEIASVFSADGGRQLSRMVERLEGLRELRAAPELRGVVQTARRLVDILRESPESTLEVELLSTAAEKDLYVLYQKLRRPLDGSIQAGRYREWLQMLASLTAAVDRLFREVLVRDEVESVRQNRLALLQAVQRLYSAQVRVASLAMEAPSQAGPAMMHPPAGGE